MKRSRVCHDFEHDDFVVNCRAAARGGALGGRAGEGRETTEALGQMLADRVKFREVEWFTAVVVERQE